MLPCAPEAVDAAKAYVFYFACVNQLCSIHTLPPFPSFGRVFYDSLLPYVVRAGYYTPLQFYYKAAYPCYPSDSLSIATVFGHHFFWNGIYSLDQPRYHMHTCNTPFWHPMPLVTDHDVKPKRNKPSNVSLQLLLKAKFPGGRTEIHQGFEQVK
ncbi:hypothetical protein B0H14DRAFT_2628873 [Mycena olivaceomarginata]|nr:hypothetical protein B0H14DRAFT_2628873 [Mycena olivaceomarginata]